MAYRFYLGTDNVTNFDVRRNTPYHVTMSSVDVMVHKPRFSAETVQLYSQLLTQYSGSPYLNIRVSGTKWGYVVI